MKIFIAGIGGTFMAGIAQLARASGHNVRGCDASVYPPMSTLLRAQNIEVAEGYSPEHLGKHDGAHDADEPDMVIIGNALSRGNPLVEYVLNENLAFCSGPEWLREQVLRRRTVIAIAGTHGKTTTSSILAWLLECDRQSPGYLIGGKPGNFAHSAKLGSGEYFVIEADEYDTAFFDKRAKFVHYRPHIAVLNNLEFDHADIYDNIGQIQKQFHHLIRLVPGNGCVVVNANDARLAQVMAMGCWSRVVRFSAAGQEDAHGKDAGKDASQVEWRALPIKSDCSEFEVLHHGKTCARVEWQCIGTHNMQNALAALVAAALAGVQPANAMQYLRKYRPPARRLQCLFQSEQIVLYDDFAHHPTAIRHTIAALREKHPKSKIIAVVELRSNTMRLSACDGGHGDALNESLAQANCAIISGCATLALSARSDSQASRGEILQLDDASKIIAAIKVRLSGNDIIITMSNGGFDGLAQQIADFLETM